MPVTEFGWPLPKRLEFLKQLSEDPAAKQYESPVDFMGKAYLLPVWRVPIGLPKYRLLNGRTSSLQQEWLAKNPAKPKGYFQRDPESDEAQKVQHDLLKQLIEEKDLLRHFADQQVKQKQHLILDHLGYVINGNRRLCAWRELLAKEPTKYPHFQHIDVIQLPKGDDQAIDRLEAELQLEPDILAEYKWHAFANMLVDRMRLHGMDEKTLARLYKKRDAEIRELLQMRDYAAEYLKARDKEGQWSDVGDEFAFKAMVKARKQLPSPGQKRLFEVGAFALLDDPQGGRLYQYIPDLQKELPELQKQLSAVFKVEAPADDPDDPLGADPIEQLQQSLAEEIEKTPESRAKAGEVIKEYIRTKELLEREKNTNDFVLKQLQKANAAVQSALTGIHRPETSRDGISETIATIESGLATLKKWLANNG